MNPTMTDLEETMDETEVVSTAKSTGTTDPTMTDLMEGKMNTDMMNSSTTDLMDDAGVVNTAMNAMSTGTMNPTMTDLMEETMDETEGPSASTPPYVIGADTINPA